MKTGDFKFEEFIDDDPAGNIIEDELRYLTSVEDPTAGAIPPIIIATIVGSVINASVALCPTTACTSKCHM